MQVPGSPDERTVLIEAPIGFGKTTFALRLLGDRDAVVIRVTPIRTGTSPTQLVALLVKALRRGGLTDLAHAVAAQEDPESGLDEFVTGLATHALEATVFLDDADRFGAAAAAALTAVLSDLPQECRLVICGRDLSGFRTLSHGARLVDAQDLALDVETIATMLGTSPDSALAREIAATTQGWPAAVALALERLGHDPSWTPGGATGVRVLLRGLLDDALAADPRAATLARLPLFDDEVARIVGGGSGPVRVVDLPSTRLGRWRSVLNSVREICAEDLRDAPIHADVVTRIAQHYRRCGETAAALALLHEHGDPAGLIEFLAGVPWSELAELDLADLRAAVDSLGPARSPDHVVLLVHVARAVELRDRTLRATWLERARLTADPDTPSGRSVAAEIARDTLRGADVEGGAAQASALLARTPPDETVTRARALVTIGMRDAFLATPASLAAAAEHFQRAADLYRGSGETALQSETLARLGYTALFLAGRLAEGAQAMAEALALLPISNQVRAQWLTMYADVLDYLGRDDASDAALREAMEIGTQRRDDMTLGMAWWTQSWLAAHRGTVEELRAALAQVELHRGPWLRSGQEAEYLGSSAERLTMAGDLETYAVYIARTVALAQELDYPTIAQIPQAFYESEHGDPARGLDLLDQLEQGPTAMASERPRRRLFRAVALLRLGREGEARAAADSAFSSAIEMGVPDLHERMHRRQLDVLAPILAVHPAVAARERATPHLRLLGRFALTVGDSDRTPPPGHPAALVKLLALGATVNAEQAIELLWPDADLGTGRARLRNTLNRLKERSGPIVVRDGDLLRLDESVKVDAVGFDTAAGDALAAPPVERVGRARHALALYTGDLLAGDVYEDWVQADRARLRRRFVALADLVTADCVSRGELDEAARLLDLALTGEPEDETRTLRLCDVLVRQGRTSMARQVARQCTAALEDLGVEPSRELRRHATR